jgi:hypothetical protein
VFRPAGERAGVDMTGELARQVAAAIRAMPPADRARAREALAAGAVEVRRAGDGAVRVRLGGAGGIVLDTHVLALTPRSDPGLS